MLLPNKLCSYNESVLSKLTVTLKVLEKGPVTVLALYNSVSRYVSGIVEYMDVLDCLYALQKVEYDEKKGVLTYVAGDPV